MRHEIYILSNIRIQNPPQGSHVDTSESSLNCSKIYKYRPLNLHNISLVLKTC